WQASFPIEHVLDFGLNLDGRAGASGEAAFDNALVVTMRLGPPPMTRVARETTWIYFDPDAALGPPPRGLLRTWVDYDDTGRTASARELLRRALFLPHPVGAEENGLTA